MKDERYRVGFGKPPRDHQFKPGQSGNPRGRPRGSAGSTLIAAMRTKRIRGGDEDPRSVDLVVGRYQQLTGNKAIDLKTGDPLDDLALPRST